MAEQREVLIRMDSTQLTQIKEAVGPSHFYSALGYLSQWNLTYGHVEITQDDTTDMVAVYRATPGAPVEYVIGAVWHEDHYGFHS